MPKFALFLLLLPFDALAGSSFSVVHSTEHGTEIVRLANAAQHVEVAIAPSIGNRAFGLKVNGRNLLYFPTTLEAFAQSEKKDFNGIPFLAPWGNRIRGGGVWANGKHYLFNAGLHNLNVNPNGIAIHGMLTVSPHWEVIDTGADEQSAHVTSRLEFWRYPDLMANWPFAHVYEMTYRLTGSGLEVATVIKNLGAEPMPVVIGFHPYFNIPDVPRADWTIHIPARQHVEMDADLVATGQFTPSGLQEEVSLRDHTFDDGFTDLVRDSSGHATFAIRAGEKKIEVVYGANYKVALVFAPPKQQFVCFEPMAAITNGINLAHDGHYNELQMVAPHESWRESFWVRFSGF